MEPGNQPALASACKKRKTEETDRRTDQHCARDADPGCQGCAYQWSDER
jgi:hypothetical protein